MIKVLLIEDDKNFAFMLIDGLKDQGFDVFHFMKGEEVMEVMDVFKLNPPDIVLLDVNLKGVIDGFEVSKEIRQTSPVPIIFTTSRTQIEDLQKGFEVGNADYLKKPFSIRELVLRIHAILSRIPKHFELEKTFQIGSYLFSPTEHSLLMSYQLIHLQKNECAVLTLLFENMGKVVSKLEILEAVWVDEDLKQKEASLNNILSSLRSKLSKDESVSILTISKKGYKLNVKIN